MRARHLIVAVGAALAGLGPAPVAARAADVVDVPVSFEVKNTNTSQYPCPSDGAEYVVRGHLTGPRQAITGPAPRAVTLYYYGYDSGEWNWRFRAVPGYDYASE